MFKRTRGYVVLSLLIVTGLASQVYSPTISSSERHFLTSALKDSRKNFSNAVNGLTQKQLNYKSATGKSIKEYCIELENFNKEMWMGAQASLQSPKEENSCVKNNHCVGTASCDDKMACHKNSGTIRTSHARWPKNGNITDCIKISQTNMVKYAKTTTEDLHAHLLETPGGKMDIYQALLAISAKTNSTVAEINKIKSDPHFPAKK